MEVCEIDKSIVSFVHYEQLKLFVLMYAMVMQFVLESFGNILWHELILNWK